MSKEKLNSMGKPHRKNAKIHKALKRYDEAQKEGVVVVNTPNPAHQPIATHPGVAGWHEKVLSTMEAAGYRAGELAALMLIALFFQILGRYEDAKEVYIRSINIARQINNPGAEGAALHLLAEMQYRHFNIPLEAIKTMEQSIDVLTKAELSRDISGVTIEHLKALLHMMRNNISGNVEEHTLIAQQNMLTTFAAEELSWRREHMAEGLRMLQQSGLGGHMEIELDSAIVSLLHGQNPNPDLSDNELYAELFAYLQKVFALFSEANHN